VEFAPHYAVPIFPLPNVVLFPRTAIPLHVFELRYRTMVRDALSAQRLLALAVLKPGWERDYHDSPEFHGLATLARIEDVEWLPNDCYDLRLSGLSRVRLGRVTREYPYRAARVEMLPQAPLTEDDPLVQLERRALIRACERWAQLPSVPGESMPAPQLDDSQPYEELVNSACTGLAADPTDKLELLALDSLIERGRLVRERIERRLRALPTTGPFSGGELN
jgi:Lon protease-like protein